MLASAFSLISPNLPIGGFSYSQALESAVELGLIGDSETFKKYLEHNLKHTIKNFELPLLKRLFESNSLEDFKKLTNKAVAMRTTIELRNEEQAKGQALVRLMRSLNLNLKEDYLEVAKSSYLSAFALFAKAKSLPLDVVLESFSFSYIESQAIAAIKLVPIGQTQAWEIIDELSSKISKIIEKSKEVSDDHIGSGLVNLSILSVLHESQYSRIFRS